MPNATLSHENPLIQGSFRLAVSAPSSPLDVTWTDASSSATHALKNGFVSNMSVVLIR
jgi:hypothetical protein